MPRTTVFKNNRSQAVRLPKAVALPDDVTEVDVIAVGNARVISPADGRWDAFFDGPTVSDDFMEDRAQPAPQQRHDPF
ncbi:MAG: type II toxin-antitoxin system VapB family antitoxin [Aestuariivirgaceae bacterium]